LHKGDFRGAIPWLGYPLKPPKKAKRKIRSWLHTLLYAVVVAVTIYAVLDLEYPRFGLIRLDAADKALVELRDSIQ
jgi:hypothetical protein